MSGVRILVGTRKGAFVLTSDAMRKGGLAMSRITGPVRFAGSILKDRALICAFFNSPDEAHRVQFPSSMKVLG